MRRETVSYLVLLCVVLSLGALAWLTRNPDSALLERAQEWPLVGSLASRFRAAYLPVSIPGAPDGARTARDTGMVERQTSRVRKVEGFTGAEPFVWLSRDTSLHAEPSTGGRVVHRFARPVRAVVDGRRADWYRVRRGSLDGWVHLPGYSELTDPPFGSDPEPVLPRPAQPPDPVTLAAALELLAEPFAVHQLGPYRTYTDVRDELLLRLCSDVARRTEDAYRERTGLVPLGEPAAEIVLYAREEAYREMVRRSEEIAGLPAEGHMDGIDAET